MSSEEDDSFEDEPGAVLAELRKARRDRHPRPSTFMLIGMVQVAALLWLYGAVGLWLLVQGRRVSGAELAILRHMGPGVIGLLLAVVLIGSVRTGLQGGPLAPDRPDILHLLLAPVQRILVLRPLASRRLVVSLTGGAGLGATLAAVSQARLGGGIPQWALAGSIAGALIGVLASGVAMLFSGRRLGPIWAVLVSLAVTLLSAFDLISGTHLSLTSWIGVIAVGPLGLDWLSLAAIPAVALLAVVGLQGVAGSSLEALDRRANLVPLLRFQAAMQDVRGFLRTRALLAQEAPRREPWFRLRRSLRGVGGAVWQRYWHSLLRWPAWRLARVTVLVLGAVGATVLVWTGSDYFLLVGGFFAYMVGMEVLEPWWQEVEHPFLTDLLPCSRLQLVVRHLVSATAAAVLFGAVAIPALVALRIPTLLLGVAALGLPPAAIAAVLGAALRSGPDPTWLETMGDALAATTPPDYAFPVAGIARVLRVTIPVGIAVVGLAPLMVARSALAQGANPFPGEALAGISVTVLVVLLLAALSRVPLFVLEKA